MKKLVLSVVLVALLAAAAFGGQAIASNKPADVTVSEETSAIWGSYYWGSPVRIQTDEGIITVSGDDTTTNIDYPQVRHVSLTLWARGVVAPDFVEIHMVMPNDDLVRIDIIDTWGLHIYEFDSDNILISIRDAGGAPVDVTYYVTTTYGRY